LNRRQKTSRRAPKQRPQPAAAINASALAKLLEVTPQAVSVWVRREDWPVATSGPWADADVENIRAWRSTLQENRAAGVQSTEDQKLKRERRRTMVIKRKALEGRLVDRDLLDAALVSLTRGFVNAIEDLERSLPLQLAGLDAAQIERVLHDRIRSMRESLSRQKVLELELVGQKIKQGPAKSKRGRPRAGE
jgi:hypothetical protein